MDRLYYFVRGLLLIAAAVGGVGWLMYRSLRRSEEPYRLIVQWIITAVLVALLVLVVYPIALGNPFFGVPLVAAVGVVIGVVWATSIGEAIAKPIASLFDGSGMGNAPQPLYSMAEAKRRLGKYEEAVDEVDKQLEQFPTDFTGMMMRAEILAENLRDVASARATIEQMIEQPDHSPRNIAFALNRLVDWDLNLNKDAATARQTLERLINMFPGTEVAYLASQRIVRLNPASTETQAERRPIPVPHQEEKLGLRPGYKGPELPTEDFDKTAACYVKRLEEFPADNEAREKLALLYADYFQRLDLALDQFEQLLAQPGAPARQVARWLNTMADLQIKHGHDLAGARQTLQRVIDNYPNSNEAEKVRQRLHLLNLELKGQQAGSVVALGTYEDNLGLKYGPPSSPNAKRDG